MTISWNPLIDTDYWSVRLSKVSLGDTNIVLSTNKAIIDTGTSYLVVPQAEFQSMMAIWSQEMICAEDYIHDLFQCLCSYDEWQSLFPPINITLS